MDSPGIELGSQQCECCILPLNYEPVSVVKSPSNLSLYSGGGWLEVMGLEVALEVEDLEFILFSEGEELAERSIGLDYLLIHKGVSLGVGADLGGYFRAGEKGALCYTEEGTERIGDRSWLGEDRFLLGDWFAVFGNGGGATTTALGGLLDFAWNLLFKFLKVGEKRNKGSLHVVNLFYECSNIADNVNIVVGSGNGWGGGYNWFGDSGGRSGNWGDDLGWCGGRDGNGGSGGWGSGLLCSTFGGGGGRAHCCYMCDRGVFYLNQTRGNAL